MEIYTILAIQKTSTASWGSHHLNQKIVNLLTIYENMAKVNRFIDIFLVFAEKQTLTSTDKTVGIELDIAEGDKAYKDIMLPDGNSS